MFSAVRRLCNRPGRLYGVVGKGWQQVRRASWGVGKAWQSTRKASWAGRKALARGQESFMGGRKDLAKGHEGLMGVCEVLAGGPEGFMGRSESLAEGPEGFMGRCRVISASALIGVHRRFSLLVRGEVGPRSLAAYHAETLLCDAREKLLISKACWAYRGRVMKGRYAARIRVGCRFRSAA